MNLNRRTFVKLSALSSVALGVNAKSAVALQDAPLKPIASQARPITREEYLQRQETARRYMPDAEVDALYGRSNSLVGKVASEQKNVCDFATETR
ncbi:MAG: hypothetical protein AABN34_19305 [Acidobacteriota bacterium]